MPKAEWKSYDPKVEYRESILDRPKMLTLVSEIDAGEVPVEQAWTAEPAALTAETSMSAALVQQASTIDASMGSETEMESALVEQAATVAPIELATTWQMTEKVGVRFFGDDLRVTVKGEDVIVEWGPSDKGPFE